MLDVMLLTYKRPEMLRDMLDNYLECHEDYPHRLWIQNNCCTPEVVEVLKEYDGYVPDFMPDEHYNDYVYIEIEIATGKIINWKPNAQKEVNKFVNELE